MVIDPTVGLKDNEYYRTVAYKDPDAINGKIQTVVEKVSPSNHRNYYTKVSPQNAITVQKCKSSHMRTRKLQ